MHIEKARPDQIDVILGIYDTTRAFMRKSGNMNQWNDSYPSEETVSTDIGNGDCMVLCEDGRIIATMAFIPGPDPTYATIYDGCWPDDSPYHVIHRIAVDEPGHDAARRLLDWGFAQTRCIRIDTHRDNVIMHHILQKYGFIRCGIIHLANGDPREAYHLNRSDCDK